MRKKMNILRLIESFRFTFRWNVIEIHFFVKNEISQIFDSPKQNINFAEYIKDFLQVRFNFANRLIRADTIENVCKFSVICCWSPLNDNTANNIGFQDFEIPQKLW